MNHLRNLTAFKAVLSDYHLSKKALATLQQTRLILLTGVSGGGRNMLISELLKTGEYNFIVSDTTRKPRVNDGVLEQTGREYWFRSEEEILADLQAGEFLEAEVIHGQQVSGISMRELEKANAANKIAINDVDIGGIKAVHALKPDTIAVLVLPPSFEVWQQRMTSRSVMPEDERQRRLQTATRIFQAGLEDDTFKFIINDNLDQAAAELHSLAKLQQVDPAQQEAGRNLAERLLIETNLALRKGA